MERIIVDKDEKILIKLRRHWIMLARDTVGTIVLAVLPFITVPFILASGVLPYAPSIPTALISYVSALWLLIVWMTLSVLWTNYYLDLWVVTDRRIISLDQIGLFNRRVTTWRMEHVQEISVIVENPVQALLNYGTLELETAGPSDTHAHIAGIPNPEKIRTVILQQVDEFRNLAQKNKQQEELLHTVSHEVKGYLSKDAAALSSISDGDLGPIPEPVKNIADSALDSTRKGIETVVDILDSANLKSGTLTLEKKAFNIRRAVIEIAEDIRHDAEHKGLAFDVEIDNDATFFNGDEEKLRRMVFRNLIDNAVRYTHSGGIQISLSQSGNTILFSVQDSGIGITPSDLSKLFTEGGKGEHSKEVNPESTGYGLFIAKQIVEAHSGKIWAESEGAGKGSKFFVELPLS